MKTKIEIEITHNDPELVAECRDAILRDLSKTTDAIIKNRCNRTDRNVLFSILSHGVIGETADDK